MKNTSIYLIASVIIASLLGIIVWQNNRVNILDEALRKHEKVDSERISKIKSVPHAPKQLSATVTDAQTPSAGALESSLKSLMGRVEALKTRAKEMVQYNIPEMGYLTDEDWLIVAVEANLDSEVGIRKALQALRTRGKVTFANEMRKALKAHAAANNGASPVDVLELERYISTATGLEALKRYHIATSNPSGKRVMTRIEEIAPVDYNHDMRMLVSEGGHTLVGVDIFREIERAATAAYQKANDGKRPASPSDLLVYMKSQSERDLWLERQNAKKN